MTNGTGLLAWNKNAGLNQRWTVHPYSQPNKFLIKSLNSGKCMDNTGNYGDGKLFHQWDCSPENANQPFTMSLPVGAQSPGGVNPPLEGKWIWLKQRDFCVKHSGNNQRVSQATCENHPDFLWKFQRYFDGTYIIISKSGNQVLDFEGESTSNGTGLLSWNKNAGTNQRWTVHPYSKPNQFLIKSLNSAKCIDNTGNYGA